MLSEWRTPVPQGPQMQGHKALLRDWTGADVRSGVHV